MQTKPSHDMPLLVRSTLYVIALAMLLGAGQVIAAGSQQAADGEQAPLFDMLPERIQQSGTLAIGANLSYPPFTFRDANGSPVGVDVALAGALADVLGVTVEWNDTPFPSLIVGLKSERFDIIMSAFADKKKHHDTYDFVDYIGGGLSLLVAQGNPKNIQALSDLCGFAAMTMKGAIKEIRMLKQASKACESAGKPGIEIKLAREEVQALLALRQDRIAAYFIGAAAVAYTAKQRPKRFDVVGPISKGNIHGIVVRKDDTQLRKAIVAAVNKIMNNGTYERILAEWKLTGIGLNQVMINLGAIEPKVDLGN